MFKFNSENIFVGYIKQLLASFNLPKYKVYTKEQQEYHDKYLEAKNNINGIRPKLIDLENQIKAETDLEKRAELVRKQHELRMLFKKYESIIEAGPEKNVLISAIRNSAPTYQTENTTYYPTYMKYIPYIKNNIIQIYAPKIIEGKITYSNNDWKEFHADYANDHGKIHTKGANLAIPKGYAYNLKIKNYTKNLKIQNNVYDSYTHEYLGDYLRFQRDYNQINLMPLYNCFSNKRCPKLDLKFEVSADKINKDTGELIYKGYSAEFSTEDSRYIIYMIPIKLFQKYTIAMESLNDVEMCCGFYGHYQYEDKYAEISKKTYKCYNSMVFDKPVLFDITTNLLPYLSPLNNLDIQQYENDLKLFIKVATNTKSSIAILEGDYTNYSNLTLIKDADNKSLVVNHAELNFAGPASENIKHLITPLQLLAQNTGISYPFADKLIEYLVGNAIVPIDEIPDNIERVKKVVQDRTNKLSSIDGVWEEKLQPLLYSYMLSHMDKPYNTHDILGYVDKELERLYSNGKTNNRETIASVDIYNKNWED